MKSMQRMIVALSIAAMGCGSDGGTEPTTPPDKDIKVTNQFLTQWSPPSAAPELPPIRESILDLGFPHELPEQARPLAVELTAPWTSGRALAYHDGELFAVDTDNGNLAVIAQSTGKITRTIAVGDRPEQVVIGPDGAAYVSVRYGRSVVKIDRLAKTVSKTATVGTEPHALALSHDAKTLYVTVAATNELVALDAETLQEIGRIDTIRAPRALAVSPNNWLVVAGQASQTMRVPLDPETGEPTGIAATTTELRASNPADHMLHFGRAKMVRPNRARGATFHPESEAVLVLHQQTMSGSEFDSLNGLLPEEFIDSPNGKGGGGEHSGYGAGGQIFSDAPHLIRPMEPSVTVVSGQSSTPSEEPAWPVKDPGTLEPMTGRIAQPTDINHHPTWSLALVTGHGSDNVLVLNTAVKDPMRSPLAIISVGMAPKAVTFSDDGQYAFVLNGQSFTISAIDLQPIFDMEESALEPGTEGGVSTQSAAADSIGVMAMNVLMFPSNPQAVHVDPIRFEHTRVTSFGKDNMPEDMRLGRRVYTYVNNNGISGESQFACASCHFEGAQDDMVWFVPGGPRQTPQLAGRLADTAPFNWLGTEHELQNNMEETIKRMGGEGLSNQELVSLEKFLKDGLVRPANPNLTNDGELTPAQKRGKDIFFDPVVACGACHVGAATTDGAFHDVGTATPIEQDALMIMQEFGQNGEDFNEQDLIVKYNTPTLRDLFATAPYLHDGSAETLRDVLDLTATTMGNTSHLSDAQKDDLVEYLKTL